MLPDPLETAGPSLRSAWLKLLDRLARPVLAAMAEGRLRATMPVETCGDATREDRARFTHLEALGRLLCGIAPWLELDDDPAPPDERELRHELRAMALRSIAHAVNPDSPDRCNFTDRGQPVVDAAFLAQALLRAPTRLRDALHDPERRRLVEALRSTRVILPWFNNWLLFSATVEAALCKLGSDWDRLRVDYAIRQHEQWYKGDGHYGDGPRFHADYYNSFVIQPMLIDVLDNVADDAWDGFRGSMRKRATRYAAVLERSISPEGTIPVVGRSLAYRCGALQSLAQAALHRRLPETVSPAQARCALSAVIRRTLDAPGTFDERGFLRVGLAGAQPSIGERYISTGSLYLCSTALLPLGLGGDDAFWRDAPAAWTSVRAYRGDDLPADHALSE